MRLQAAFLTTNRNPLGACAITGTGFAIDRHLTSELLGFDGPTGNTYGSIATVDYLLESVSATAVLLTGLGRFVQDLLLWGTVEFSYVRFGDGFVQSSSIMPQKRNPVAIEHARAIGSKALGQAQAIVVTVHNTPFGDVVDTEDDLQPLVSSMFRDAVRAVGLVAAAMQTAEFDPVRLEARAGEGGTTLTELADTLARDHDLPFVTAHAIAGKVLKARVENPESNLSAVLAGAAMHTVGRPLLYSDEDLRRILSPRHFVNVRTTLGGPAPTETGRALAESVRCSTSTMRGSTNAARRWPRRVASARASRRDMTPLPQRHREHRADRRAALPCECRPVAAAQPPPPSRPHGRYAAGRPVGTAAAVLCGLCVSVANDATMSDATPTSFKITAARVLAVEAAVLLALWLVGRYFSS